MLHKKFGEYDGHLDKAGPLENEDTFAVIGASVAENFDIAMPEGTIGKSILGKLM